jgi:N-acetylglucosaminyldiphosphoundecaprenol N-acetyl-beta-D-mannosaminyltransferase
MSNSAKRVELLGVGIDPLTINQAVTAIIDHAADPTRPAGYAVKPYVEFLDRAAGDPSLRQILNEASLVLADGVALIWAAHYLHASRPGLSRFCLSLAQIVLKPAALRQPLPQRIGGLNLVWPMLQAAANQGLRIYLIGQPTQAAINHTADTLRQKLPGINIVGARPGRDLHHPTGQVGEAWIQETLQILQAAKADLILVGMGFPLQERLMARWAPHLDHGLLIGEGGTFDYEQLGGKRRRAPQPVQHLGLEWLWRLILQPRRWRRQLAIPRFVGRVWHAKVTTQADAPPR